MSAHLFGRFIAKGIPFIGPITDGNDGKLFNTITDNSDRVNFAASIAPDGKSVVLTAVGANAGTVLLVR